MKDYYLILGVSRNATADQIKSAYRALTLRYHPDRNQDNDFAREQFLLINEAYEILGDPNSRRDYDLKSAAPRSNKERPRQQKQSPTNVKNQKNTSTHRIPSPMIDFFVGDRREIYLGEEITFSWKCSFADSAYLYPIGLVPVRGSKTIRFTKADSAQIKVELTAYNTESLEKTTQTILIDNINQLPKERQREIKIKRTKKWFYERRYGLSGVLVFFFMVFLIVSNSEPVKEDKQRFGYVDESELMILDNSELILNCKDSQYVYKSTFISESKRTKIYDEVFAICEQDVSPEMKDRLIKNFLKYVDASD